MTFSQNIKQEILEQHLNRDEAFDLIQGILDSSAIKKGEAYTIRINDEKNSNTIREIILELGYKIENVSDNKNWIKITNFDYKKTIKHPSYYFGGAFVGGGSISDKDSNSYHLEIQMYSKANADKMREFLNNYSFKFSILQRRNNWIIYIKKADHISDFLKAIQSFKALLVFEDKRILRDATNSMNRYANLDTYNQKKLADSNYNFQEYFNYVNDRQLWSKFKNSEIFFYKIKMNHPYNSLTELTELYNNQKEDGMSFKTRSGTNHWIRKLKKHYIESL